MGSMATVSLSEFIGVYRDDIIRRCRAKAATRSAPPPITAELDHGVPLFLDQLVEALRLGEVSSPEISRSAVLHGHDLLLQGFTIAQVVRDYGDVCQSITGLAMEINAPISTGDFRTLNRCLDDAIACAVTEFSRGRDVTRDEESAHGNEPLGFLAHELRNLTNTAMLAFEVLKTGNVGVGGSTGAVIQRSLLGIRSLVSRSLAEVRLSQGIQNSEPFLVSTFIEELLPSAILGANAKNVTLRTMPVEAGVMIEADRQVLASVVENLLQNAFKFTRPGTTVTLRVGAGAERVLIEIQDECGGLQSGNVTTMFRPFEQRSTDRTGLGLGLAFSRWAVQANHGRIYARDLPAEGCIFTIDMPRLQVPVAAA
jgi:signal transduction histidine kinase